MANVGGGAREGGFASRGSRAVGAPGDAGVDRVEGMGLELRADLADRGCGERAQEDAGRGPGRGRGRVRRRVRIHLGERRGGWRRAATGARARLTLETHTRLAAGTEQVPVPASGAGPRASSVRHRGDGFHGTTRERGEGGRGGGRGRVQSPTHHVPFSSSRVTHFRRNDGMSPRGGPTPSSPGVARNDVPRGCEQFSGRVRCDATGGEK